jgi:hypothetical protein
MLVYPMSADLRRANESAKFKNMTTLSSISAGIMLT